jgi:hypothetical protein
MDSRVTRRGLLAASLAATTGAGTLLASACRPSGQGGASAATANTAPKDLRAVASSLQAKTQILVDAINAKNDATIAKAKTDLSKEADVAEDAIQSETGATANQINSAVQYIRTGSLSNNLQTLNRANDLLKQAAAP